MLEDLINLLAGNLGIGFENLILVLTILGSLIFFAKDMRIGAIILLMLLSAEFIVFVQLGMETFAALMGVLTSIVILTLSLYITHSKSTTGII